MSNNKTINQFPTDVVLTGTEYILGMSEGVTIKLVLDNIKSFVLSGQSSGSTAVYLTGATYDNSTGTLNLINSSGETIPVTGFYTGGTSDLPIVYVTGGTYSDGVATFTNTTGGTFDVTGFYTGDTKTLQDVVNANNGISNYLSASTASIQSTNFINNRTLYLNDDAYPTIKLVDNLDGANNLTIDVNTLNIDGVSYNWSDIVNQVTGATLQVVTTNGNTTTDDIQLINNAELIFGTGGGVLLDNGSRLREGTIDAGYGGSKGIAQICAVGYELKWEAGRLYIMNDNGTTIREVRYTFANIPTVSDDISKGFIVGSRWVLDNGDIYSCSDNTLGAAVWVLVTGLSASDLGFVITPIVSSVINQNVILPENSNVTYPSPLTVGAGYTITVPSTTTLTII